MYVQPSRSRSERTVLLSERTVLLEEYLESLPQLIIAIKRGEQLLCKLGPGCLLV